MFWHQLAGYLGQTVEQAQNGMDAEEFARWQAYDRLDPIGQWRADLRAARIASTIANIWRGPRTRPYRLEDFMPKFGAVAVQRGADWIKTVLMGIAATYGKVVRHGDDRSGPGGKDGRVRP